MHKDEIIKQARLALARKNLFYYCNIKSPEFYKESRAHLIDLCNAIQDFDSSSDDVLIINLPPRHGKSRTVQNYVEWALGRNKDLKIMTASYNETVATQFSKGVRNSIQEIKAGKRIVYSEIFPSVKIKQGDAAANLWSLSDGYLNYLATSPTGTATGFGADRLIIDDLIKNALEANNENTLNNQWAWFTDTMLTRLEKDGKIIIIMTRWHRRDLAGMALSELPQAGYKVQHISMKALKDDGTMLCDEILPRDEYERKIKTMGEDIASANYLQEPIDLKGVLYSAGFLTYEAYDEKAVTKKIAYIDTADEGKDYLCMVSCDVIENTGYITDVYYTQDSMEKTEEETARRLNELETIDCIIESNNGGRSFARNVERKLKEKGNTKCNITWFHQNKNKKSRILTQSNNVQKQLIFPENWRLMFPEYYKAMTTYQKSGKNAHDDAPDASTGIIEYINGEIKGRGKIKTVDKRLFGL